MISMSKAYSIRQPRMEGDSIAEISRKLEVSRDTVRLQVPRDGGSLAEAARAARQGQRARPVLALCLNGFHCTNERNYFSPMSVLCVVK